MPGWDVGPEIMLKEVIDGDMRSLHVSGEHTVIHGINVKKLQFIHKLTASDTSKTAKIIKR